MCTSIRLCIIRVIIAILFLFWPISAQSVVVENSNAWSGIFAGEEVPYQITLSGKPHSHTAISWKLTTKGRTLSVGQQSIQFADSATVVASLSLRMPALKSQIKIPATLEIDVSDNDQYASTTSYEFKINIYGSDLLLTERNAFQQLDIRLYDPVGKTAKLFKLLTIPFTSLTKDELLGSRQQGLIVLGSAIALNPERGMVDRLIELAANGRAILIFQPSSGAIPMPGRFAHSEKQASAVSFADDSVIETFASGCKWISNDPMRLFGLDISSYREETVAEITQYKESSWSWLHIAFGQTDGRFTVCMLPVVEHASDSPVAQIILGRLLTFAGSRHSDVTTAKQRKTER